MGGFFTVDVDRIHDRKPNPETVTSRKMTITPQGIRLLSLIGRLPQIYEVQIQDKSKA